MKRILFLITFVISIQTVSAQPPKRIEKLEALKVAYITQQLNLTAEEAQKFWPIYNSYMNEFKEARKKGADDELKFQEEILNIKKKYKPEFKKVLGTDERVNQFFKAEIEFMREVKKELQKRMQQRRNQLRDNPPPQ